MSLFGWQFRAIRSAPASAPDMPNGSRRSAPRQLSGSESMDASSNSSLSQSQTPPTSVADSTSSAPDATMKSGSTARTSQRLQHSPSNISSYNENVLRAATRDSRRKTTDAISHNVSGETLIANEEDEQEKFVEQTVRPLSRDFDIGPMPGDDLKWTDTPKAEMKRRKSTRLDVLEKASALMERTNGAVDRTASVLGKRGRDTVDISLGRLRSLKTLKQSKQRGKVDFANHLPSFEGPVAKRARLSQGFANDESPPREAKPGARTKARKKYLAQGLYVGQNRDFDPRLTETKNKLRRAINEKDERKRKPILPLPMFAGQRTMESGRLFKLPFDIFSPLPPGQPKPDEWKKTNKNVFIGDAGEVWRKPEKLAQSRCLCTPVTGCNEDCHNRLMLYECDSTNCRLTHAECGNRAFADLQARVKAGGKYRIGVEVCKTADRGHGVRANRTFEPNQVIVEYTGEIITQEECDNRLRTRYKDAECYYLMDFDQSMILDATRGSIARFINHSCEPNCRMIKWTVAGKPRMALFAGDNGIMTGEELTYDYNFDPYSTKNVQECRCGTPSCRGVLGPKPKDIKDALKPIVGAKRKLGDVVSEGVEAVKAQTKKRKIAVASSIRSAIASAQEGASSTLASARASASSKLSRARSLAASSATAAAAATAKPSEKERLVKRASERSLRGITKSFSSSTVRESNSGGRSKKLQRRHTIVTYSRSPVKRNPSQLNSQNHKKPTRLSGKITDYLRIPSTASLPLSSSSQNNKHNNEDEHLAAGDRVHRKSLAEVQQGTAMANKNGKKSSESSGARSFSSRSQGVRDKVGSVRKGVVRTVTRKGAGARVGNSRNGSGKTIRVIEG